MFIPKTQKARGLVALTLNGNNLHSERAGDKESAVQVPTFSIIGAGEFDKVESFWEYCVKHINSAGIFFARPCPKVPRHGFVESRKIKGIDELIKLMEEVMEKDPDGEVMLMPVLNGFSSAIWTPSMLTIGKGSAGATAGSEVVGIVPMTPVDIAPTLRKAAGIPEDASPFVEIVDDYVVQLRHGPKSEFSYDFIPRDMVVKEVVKASGDLLEWESVVQKIAENGVEGVVVDHFGGGLCSHYAVHCMIHKIPCITSFVPEVGMELKATQNKVEIDYNAILTWLLYAIRPAANKQFDSLGSLCVSGIFALHNNYQLQRDNPALLGLLIGGLYKLCLAACHGEARHFTDKNATREGKYNETFREFHRFRSEFVEAVCYPFRDSMISSGVGGVRWSQCAISTLKVEKAIARFLEEPGEATWGKVIGELNLLVNFAHNNGWWLNKFAHESVFEALSEGGIKAALTAYTSLMDILEKIGTPKPSVLKRIATFHKKLWLESPSSDAKDTLRPVYGYSESWLYDPGISAIFGTTHKSRVIPVIYLPPKACDQLKALWLRRVRVKANPDNPEEIALCAPDTGKIFTDFFPVEGEILQDMSIAELLPVSKLPKVSFLKHMDDATKMWEALGDVTTSLQLRATAGVSVHGSELQYFQNHKTTGKYHVMVACSMCDAMEKVVLPWPDVTLCSKHIHDPSTNDVCSVCGRSGLDLRDICINGSDVNPTCVECAYNLLANEIKKGVRHIRDSHIATEGSSLLDASQPLSSCSKSIWCFKSNQYHLHSSMSYNIPPKEIITLEKLAQDV